MFKKSLFAVAAAATAQAAVAQQAPPGVGVQLQQIPPPPVPAKAAPDISFDRPSASLASEVGGPAVRVDALHVTGQTLYPEAELIAATGFLPGRTMTLGELRNAAARISDFYNARGHFLAQAYVPEQNVSAGSVTIAVIEGRYGKIDVRNTTRLADQRALSILSGLDSGDIVATAPLERRLLLLSDVPGVRVKSTLAPGAAVGTSDLIVDIAPARSVTGSVEADNAGNRYTGTYRLGGSLYVNNPAGIGDVLSLRVLGSSGGLGYGRVAYQAPVGNLTVGAAYTHLRYELGREFNALDAQGKADIFSVFASYPLIRSRNANLYALASLDYKLLEDDIGVTDTRSRRNSGAVTLGLSGDTRDSSGWNSFSAGMSFGNLHFKDPLERAADRLTARSGGGFGKFQASVARLQTISGSFTVYGAVRGQVAFNNLDSSEKMELGGAYAVRAYPEGEAYGDTGYVATIEPRLNLDRWTPGLPGHFQLIGFIDTGEVRYAHNPWFVGSNHASRSGFGGGVNWFGPHGLALRASYARRLGDEKVTSGPDRSGRFWFQISKLF
ncbi:ShlB/FhaC/HecB family hemolysin secretion/activation protein [Sphingomonas crusticola]|uniref:ShlB/FhaC/HecB family hemolysin secretion/activation protein n=1 Tax=Sphingomonas crusticola TaxID=1697973 RepID=UPI000E22B0AD|nr:ShlB/FhaC/HecB family hemolysin secretion/activation protein [Sphingomonas crusticola]